MTVCIDCKERTSSDVLTFFVMYDGGRYFEFSITKSRKGFQKKKKKNSMQEVLFFFMPTTNTKMMKKVVFKYC